jgi:hypothetical protein
VVLSARQDREVRVRAARIRPAAAIAVSVLAAAGCTGGRPTSKPVTITSAAVFLIEDLPQRWGLAITVRPGERAALAAVSTRAVRHQLAIIVAGKAWAIVLGQAPLTHGRFEIPGLTRTGVSTLRRMLVQSG